MNAGDLIVTRSNAIMLLSAKTPARGFSFGNGQRCTYNRISLYAKPLVYQAVALRALGRRVDHLMCKGFCVMQTITLQNIFTKLAEAEQATLEATDIDRIHDGSSDITVYEDIITHCQQIERNAQRVRFIAEQRRKAFNSQPASEAMMTTFIVKQIEKEGPAMKKAVDIAGGIKSAALRRADGKCELCGDEWHLSVHHIISRTSGGLNELDNLIVLCGRCHNEVEDCGYRSRVEALRHSPSHVIRIKQKREDHNGLPDLTPSEKAAITRQENIVKEARIDQEVTEWCEKWDKLFAKCVAYIRLGDKPPADPDWYVIVYGAGRHSASLDKRSLSATAQ